MIFTENTIVEKKTRLVLAMFQSIYEFVVFVERSNQLKFEEPTLTFSAVFLLQKNNLELNGDALDEFLVVVRILEVNCENAAIVFCCVHSPVIIFSQSSE